MRQGLFVLGIAIVTFVLTFFTVTALTDAYCRYSGYYQAGIDDEKGLYE